MNWVLHETTEEDYSVSPVPSVNLNAISPSILLIILILAAIFFISGLLHLLVRILFGSRNIDTQDLEDGTAFQGQLQQLFHLHDAGVDQSFIDTLPVFLYKAIIGLKNPFDCAVCLCEFEPDDKLSGFSPILFVLESGGESAREIAPDANTSSRRSTCTQLGIVHGEGEFGASCKDELQKSHEITIAQEAKVVSVKLGKFRNADAIVGGEGSSSNSTVDGRRCFSMGSFEYVMDDNSLLQVAIKPTIRKQSSTKPSLPLAPGHRSAMSECDCHSTREFYKGLDIAECAEFHGGGNVISTTNNSTSVSNSAAVGGSKRESFSISKIWLRSKEKPPLIAGSSSRALSFRLPLQQIPADELKSKCNCKSRNSSEVDSSRCGRHGAELGLDVEVESSKSLESQPNPPSFARRTLLRIAGRQNKLVHSSSTLNV
ncbi:RING-H2 finger protein ATL13-like protein [Cinnamomum micranthum f. kanehirae]|uniref:RING-H2 finger protein ATL13-like protein n=1 Tax=Cinnamomum micranthum f. kanehirae TaxID=337451 RepID=A0A3S3QXM8_9MAGN|nr:RING-H2 finger protein ATL13-like protein [Cinnamomum micranthum f. kanehirae]